MSSLCPVCQNVPMKPVRDPRTGLGLDICPRCQGWWLDGGELWRLVKAQQFSGEIEQFDTASQGADADALAAQRRKEARFMMVCCKCSTIMHTRVFGGVTIDACQKCRSLWFDKGELGMLLSDKPALTDLMQQRDLTAQAMWEDEVCGILGAVLSFLAPRRRGFFDMEDYY
jgi:Zn-finger nucleic acid-binding protein